MFFPTLQSGVVRFKIQDLPPPSPRQKIQISTADPKYITTHRSPLRRSSTKTNYKLQIDASDINPRAKLQMQNRRLSSQVSQRAAPYPTAKVPGLPAGRPVYSTVELPGLQWAVPCTPPLNSRVSQRAAPCTRNLNFQVSQRAIPYA